MASIMRDRGYMPLRWVATSTHIPSDMTEPYVAGDEQQSQQSNTEDGQDGPATWDCLELIAARCSRWEAYGASLDHASHVEVS